MKARFFLALACVFAFSGFISCTEDDPVVIYNGSTDENQKPTGEISAITDTVMTGITYATIYGQTHLSPQELAAANCGIFWGTDEDLTWANKIAFRQLDMSSGNTYSVKVTSLLPGTTYYYRFYVRHGASFGLGPLESFTTDALQLENGDAEGVDSVSARFSARVNLTPAELDSVSLGVLWSTADNPTWESKASYQMFGAPEGDRFTAQASWFFPGTQYFYRPFVCVDSLYLYGPVKTFTTAAGTAEGEALTVNGVAYQLVAVEGGTFQMGRDSTYENERPAHSVSLSSFRIGQTEVTQGLWVAVMGSNPSEFVGCDSLPVERVSWEDCQVFIRKLNQLTGKTFRLPTEAEWEYAARGGRQSGGYTYSGSNMLSYVAWHTDNGGETTHRVALKEPNELGLYDMSGNVWEWCQDWYDAEWYAVSPRMNPSGPRTGVYHVGRGGCWSKTESFCRVTRRLYDIPTKSFCDVGFRLAL